MIPNLNKMPEDIIRENIEWAREDKEKAVQRIKSSDVVDPRAYGLAVNAYRDLGLFLYQQEAADNEVIENLSPVGDYWFCHVKSTESDPNSDSNIRHLVEAIEYAVCFGSKESISDFCDMSEALYADPLVVGIQPLTEYIRFFKRYLSGLPVSAAEIESVRRGCLADTAEKVVKTKYSEILRGMMAIESGAETELRSALSEVLAYHVLESKKGQYKEDPRAFICMSCMMLIKLAKSKGMDLSLALESPYVPVRMLG